MTVTIPSYDIPIYVLGTDRKLWIEKDLSNKTGQFRPGAHRWTATFSTSSQLMRTMYMF